MIVGVGTDIIEISRIEKAMKKYDAFGLRVFTPEELAYCKGTKTKWASLAGRFAAKEAVSKALGTGIGSIEWIEIEIVNNNSGKPEVVLHGNAAEKARLLGVEQISISLSHCNAYAVAYAIAH